MLATDISLLLSMFTYLIIFCLVAKIIFSIIYVTSTNFIEAGKNVFPWRSVSHLICTFNFFDKESSEKIGDYINRGLIYLLISIVYMIVVFALIRFVNPGNVFNIILVFADFIGLDLFIYCRVTDGIHKPIKKQ